jgi:hypothetical protein
MKGACLATVGRPLGSGPNPLLRRAATDIAGRGRLSDRDAAERAFPSPAPLRKRWKRITASSALILTEEPIADRCEDRKRFPIFLTIP